MAQRLNFKGSIKLNFEKIPYHWLSYYKQHHKQKSQRDVKCIYTTDEAVMKIYIDSKETYEKPWIQAACLHNFWK